MEELSQVIRSKETGCLSVAGPKDFRLKERKEVYRLFRAMDLTLQSAQHLIFMRFVLKYLKYWEAMLQKLT